MGCGFKADTPFRASSNFSNLYLSVLYPLNQFRRGAVEMLAGDLCEAVDVHMQFASQLFRTHIRFLGKRGDASAQLLVKPLFGSRAENILEVLLEDMAGEPRQFTEFRDIALRFDKVVLHE